jgi:hypothetical protein
LLKKVAVEPHYPEGEAQQELKNSESEDDSMFHLSSMFFEFALYNAFIHLFNMLWVSIMAIGRIR